MTSLANNSNCVLLPHHVEHLLKEGFTSKQIDKWLRLGLRSLTEEEAMAMGFKVWVNGEWNSGSGIYFPFTSTFGQVRLDKPIVRDNGKIAKYLTPCKKKTQAYIPNDCRVITEGVKDAMAACLLGKIPTGALAGVSHYRKALPKGAGFTTLFDADGRHNPQVFLHLFNCGLWLNGKIQLLPEISGHPKAGLCEYFKAGHTTEDYQKLIDSALSPKELLLSWPNYWDKMPDNKLSMAIKVAINLAAAHLDVLELETLLQRIKKATKISIQALRTLLQAASALQEKKLEKAAEKEAKFANKSGPSDYLPKNHREKRYLGVTKALSLDIERCVTSQTFDGWTLEKVFSGGKNWMSKNEAYYRYEGNGAWIHVSDCEVEKRIADASGRVYKLKFSKDFGWQELYHYQSNYHLSSAFKFCRKALLPKNLPDNSHLVAFKNCTVDMRTGETLPHERQHYITRYIPFDYVPGKPCPEPFLKFIESSFGMDLLPTIRAFTSMFCDPTAPYGKFPHLIGPSGSGKGTLGRLWNQIYGTERSISLSAFKDTATAEGRYQYLTGKSICGFPDVGGYQEGLRAFYELVDNGEMSGRPLYSSNSDQVPWNCRFWVASVDHLQVENTGDGWGRRVCPIPTLNAPKETDPFLTDKLKESIADIISWALAMPSEERDAILLHKSDNPRILEVKREAELQGDSAKVFTDMCLRPIANNSAFIDKHDMHSKYVAFCKSFGYVPTNFKKFNNHLKTFLDKNHIPRAWGPMKNGERERIPAHWGYLEYVPRSFENVAVTNGDSYQNSSNEPVWVCNKSRCIEGGLLDIEEFWNPPEPPDYPPSPPDNNGNNGGGDGPKPQSPSPETNGQVPNTIVTGNGKGNGQVFLPAPLTNNGRASTNGTNNRAIASNAAIKEVCCRSPEVGSAIAKTIQNINDPEPVSNLKTTDVKGCDNGSAREPATIEPVEQFDSEDIANAISWLENCHTFEDFIECFYPNGEEPIVSRQLLNVAVKHLAPEKYEQIKQWVLAIKRKNKLKECSPPPEQIETQYQPSPVSENSLIGARVRSKKTGKGSTVVELHEGESMPVVMVRLETNLETELEANMVIPVSPNDLIFEDGSPFPTFSQTPEPLEEQQPLLNSEKPPEIPRQIETDWSSYPNPLDSGTKTDRERATALKEGILAAHAPSDLKLLKSKYSLLEIEWVRVNFLNDTQRKRLEELTSSEQLKLFH
ncbi:MAG: hypothetical protein QNJ54_25400 [Prochloraceae cyanobacterium]|nr:hypothetical protein [Prochloraceae cyanobacterium]